VTRATRESECVPRLRDYTPRLLFDSSLLQQFFGTYRIRAHTERYTHTYTHMCARAYTPTEPPPPPALFASHSVSHFLHSACSLASSSHCTPVHLSLPPPLHIALSSSFPPHSDSLVDSRIRRATRVSPGLLQNKAKRLRSSQTPKIPHPFALLLPLLPPRSSLLPYSPVPIWSFIFFVFVDDNDDDDDRDTRKTTRRLEPIHLKQQYNDRADNDND
jgi:hypothetical protein